MGRSQVAYNRRHGRGGSRGHGKPGSSGRGGGGTSRTTKRHLVDGDNSWRYHHSQATTADLEADLESRVQALEAHGANYSQFGSVKTLGTDETEASEGFMAEVGLDLSRMAKTLRNATPAQRTRISPRIAASLEKEPQLDSLTGSSANSLATDKKTSGAMIDGGTPEHPPNGDVVDEDEEDLNAWLDDMIS